MYKRLCALGAALMLAVWTGLSAFAVETANVIDTLDYLTQEDAASLQGTIDGIAANYSLDAVIVITDDTEGKSSMEYADDYYDYGGFGIGADYSGLLLLINMAEREAWISTCGQAIFVFTDERIAAMIDDITGYLGDGDYLGGCERFLSNVSAYAQAGVPENQYTEYHEDPIYYEDGEPIRASYGARVLALMTNPVPYLIALAVAAVVTLPIAAANKGKVTITAKTYEQPGTFALTREEDTFLREHVTRVKISHDSGGGGGGSSVHSSSSGRSHGGGGGHF